MTELHRRRTMNSPVRTALRGRPGPISKEFLFSGPDLSDSHYPSRFSAIASEPPAVTQASSLLAVCIDFTKQKQEE
jgi:hypothetical protein